jgi:hypothetical protein
MTATDHEPLPLNTLLPDDGKLYEPLCTVHLRRHWDRGQCPTDDVLDDIRAERARQVFRYGDNADTPDGTGPEVMWLNNISGLSATTIEKAFRDEYESHGEVAPSWMHLVREEVAEAFLETNPTRLRAELVQVGALVASWIEQIDRRAK